MAGALVEQRREGLTTAASRGDAPSASVSTTVVCTGGPHHKRRKQPPRSSVTRQTKHHGEGREGRGQELLLDRMTRPHDGRHHVTQPRQSRNILDSRGIVPCLVSQCTAAPGTMIMIVSMVPRPGQALGHRGDMPAHRDRLSSCHAETRARSRQPTAPTKPEAWCKQGRPGPEAWRTCLILEEMEVPSHSWQGQGAWKRARPPLPRALGE